MAKGLNLSVLMIIGIVVLSTTKIAVNQMQSLPFSYFIIFPWMTPKIGDYAVIEGHQTKFSKNAHFVKQIAAVEGDFIVIENNTLFINAQAVATLKNDTKTKEPLTPIYSMVIPRGYVFVLAPHERSFDSRYKEFGLVRVQNIQGRALGIGG